MQLINGVHHAGQVLELFSVSEPEWGAAAVGRALGLSRSHAHRLLSTLSDIGLLDRIAPGGRFRLSWAAFGYSKVVLESDPLVSAALPILQSLRTTHGLQSMLGVWRGGSVLSLEFKAAPTVTRLDIADCVGLGLVLLSGLPDDELAATFASSASTPRFPAGPELRRAIREVRDGGVLICSSQDHRDGRWLVAPVLSGDTVAAAVAAWAPVEHCPDGQTALMVVKRAAAALAHALSRSSAGERVKG